MFVIYARIPTCIYQAPKHLWKQSDMPEPAVFVFREKKMQIVNLSFIFSWANSTLHGLTSHISSSINPLHSAERMSMASYFCVVMTVIKSWVYAVHFTQLVISDTPFCHKMRTLIIIVLHGEVV